MYAIFTPDVFDALIIGLIVIGLALAAVRLYADFTRPLPPSDSDVPTEPTPVVPDALETPST
ncbi:MAG: hypothetical protein SGJ24_15715 [Chloroflexota bacterium]|nr:hypothetical protein [Chloroflexota bacterium]